MPGRRAGRAPRPLVLAAGAGAAVIAGGAVIAVAGSGGGGSALEASGSTPTTTIERRDLVEVQTEDGTLGYADSRTVVNRMAGTVTRLPRAGTVVRTNHRLYAVDGKAVYLLDGSSPAYRDLAPGIAGQDVAALERNLRALGKDRGRAMAVDGTWDAGTTAAVTRWQHDKGLAQTGTIELGRVVFAPGDRRVSSLELKVGASAGTGGGGANQPAAYDGADPGSTAAMRLVAYRAPDNAPDGAPPATTTPRTTTTPQIPPTTTTTPQTATTPQTTTTPKTATTPKPSPKTPADPAPPTTSAPGSGDRGRATAAAAASAPAADRGSSPASGDSGSGEAVSTPIMTTTSTRRIVTVKLDTTKESVAVKGARVTVELPSGDLVRGRIARVGTTATSEQAADGNSSAPTIKLTIKLTGNAKAIDQAPVSVRLERSRRRDVLAIPVTALMARVGGTFAVEVVERAGRRVVPVTTGLFTSGYVEIEGDGLKQGMRVANAAV